MDTIGRSECEGTETYINLTGTVHLSICVHIFRTSKHCPPEMRSYIHFLKQNWVLKLLEVQVSRVTYMNLHTEERRLFECR
jgi:hypothetical protein